MCIKEESDVKNNEFMVLTNRESDSATVSFLSFCKGYSG